MTPAALLMLLLELAGLAYAYDATAEPPEVNSYAEGCYVCADYRCPTDPTKCLLGTVSDSCGCCSRVCARLEGESCWSDDIAELPKERRNEGLCASEYACRLRDDLEPEDIPEATCVCLEPRPACGSNNRTYPTVCALNEEAKRQPDSNLALQHLGPCPSLPIIYSPPDNVNAEIGQLVTLGCEAKGFPLPDVFWEFYSADGEHVFRLPYDEVEDGVVNNSEIPGTYIRTSWLQVERFKRYHAGIYHCIANNSIGQASAASIVSIG